MIRSLAILLLSCVVVFGQPAPVLRNAWTTNIAGTPVRSVSDLSVTNFTTATATQWNFYGVGPNTIARLVDISNIVNSASGSATNAISTVQSNGVTVTSMATNLNFVDNPTAKVLITNNPSGLIHVSFTNTIGATTTDLNAASNFLYGIVGETNWLGDAGITNATRIGLADGKANNTNLIKTLLGGDGILLTNQGTNVLISVNRANVSQLLSVFTNSSIVNGGGVGVRVVNYTVHSGITILATDVGGGQVDIDIGPNWTFVASQTNLNTSSNVLYGVRGQVRVNTNGVFVGAETNLNFVQGSGLIILATNNAGSNGVQHLVDWTQVSSQTNLNNASNALYGVRGQVRIQTNDVLVGAETNLSFIPGNGILVKGTNFSGTNKIQFSIDTSVVATLTDSSNNVTVAAGAGSFVDTNSSGNKMVYTVSSVTNNFLRLPVQSYLPGTNPPAPGLDQGTNQTWRLLFDDSTNETAYYQFTLPDRYFTNANLMISWSVLASAASKSNVFKVACMVVPAAGGVNVNVDSYNSTNSFTNIVMSVGYVTNTVISCGISNAVANDFIKLKLWREGTDAFDNNSGDSAVHALLFEYDEKKP